MEYKPVARSSDLVVQEVGDETLVYDLRDNKAKCLNETSARVWKLCDGTKSATEITIALSAELKTKVDENLVWFAFEQLQKEELLNGDLVKTSRFEGLSRREIVKKVGFVAVIALPIVSSVVAPTSANAQSGIPLCTTPGSGVGCDCGTPSSSPTCVAALNFLGFMSFSAGPADGSLPCVTSDVKCPASACITMTSPGCCDVNNTCPTGPGMACCSL